MAVRDPLVRPLRPAPSPAMWRAGRKRPTGMCTWSWEYLAFLELVKLILVFHVSSSTCRYLNTISFWDQLSREGRAKRSRRDSGVAWRIKIRARGSHRRPPSCSDCRLVKSCFLTQKHEISLQYNPTRCLIRTARTLWLRQQRSCVGTTPNGSSTSWLCWQRIAWKFWDWNPQCRFFCLLFLSFVGL